MGNGEALHAHGASGARRCHESTPMNIYCIDCRCSTVPPTNKYIIIIVARPSSAPSRLPRLPVRKSITAGVIFPAADATAQLFDKKNTAEDSGSGGWDLPRTLRWSFFGFVVQAPWNHVGWRKKYKLLYFFACWRIFDGFMCVRVLSLLPVVNITSTLSLSHVVLMAV